MAIAVARDIVKEMARGMCSGISIVVAMDGAMYRAKAGVVAKANARAADRAHLNGFEKT